MPKGTRVARCKSKVMRKNKSMGVGNAIAICQKSTGQSYATGKSLKKKPMAKKSKGKTRGKKKA